MSWRHHDFHTAEGASVLHSFFLLQTLFHDLERCCCNMPTGTSKFNQFVFLYSQPFLQPLHKSPPSPLEPIGHIFSGCDFISRHSFFTIPSIICKLILHHTLSNLAIRFSYKYSSLSSSVYTSHHAAIESPTAHTYSLSFRTGFAAKSS